MRWAWILGIVLILLLVGCQRQELTAQSISVAEPLPTAAVDQPDEPVEAFVDLCQGSCTDKQICIEGACECKDAYRECGGECIPRTSCCDDDDCGDMFCNENKVCESHCVGVYCPIYEVCSEQTQECACEEGTRFCEEEGMCIPEDACCTHFDCQDSRIRNKCTDIHMSTEVCVTNSTGPGNCKLVEQGATKRFYYNDEEIVVFISQIFSGDVVDLKVGDTIIEKAKSGEQKKIDFDTFVSVEKIRVRGGECVSFDRVSSN